MQTTNPHSHSKYFTFQDIPLSLNTDFHDLSMTKIMQIHNLSALNRRQLQNVREKIGGLFKVVVSYLIVGNSMSSE